MDGYLIQGWRQRAEQKEKQPTRQAVIAIAVPSLSLSLSVSQCSAVEAK